MTGEFPLWLSGLRPDIVSLRMQVLSLDLLSGLRIWHCHSCSIGPKWCSDPELLWLWCRPAAVAPIPPLAWEPPYATGVALKRKRKKKRGEKCDAL